MRKFKGLFASVSLAAMLAASAVTGYAEETETTETVEAAAETEQAAEDTAAAPEDAQITVHADMEVSVADQQALASYAEQSIGMIVGMTDEQLDEVIHPTTILSVPQDSIVASVDSWMTAKEELGAFQTVKSHDITVDDDMITVETTCEFEKSTGTVSTILDRSTLTLEGMNFSGAEQSFGTKMKEAALNTLMGMGVVFLVLIFLSWLIGLFKHIGKIGEESKKDAAPAPAPKAAPAVPVAAPVVEEVTDDGELIAVIAAAIAAAEGTSTDGFVVRSIKKSNRNKWQRA